MSPSWIPLCRSMQRYCEPFFAAVENWRNYKSEDILRNRLHLVECAQKVLSEFSNCPENYEFDLEYENQLAELLPEFIPSGGKNFMFGGDSKAYDAAKSLVPERIFTLVGLFFQTNILKGVAGFSENYLATANQSNRESIINSIEKLLRVPESAGKAKFVFRRLVSNGAVSSASNYLPYNIIPLTAKGQSFLESLLATRKSWESSKRSNTSSDVRGQKKKTKKEYYGVEEEDIRWVTKHVSVGVGVASHFMVTDDDDASNKPYLKVFTGKVIRYAHPSKGKADQLYHILWEDGDEEEYDQIDFEKATNMFNNLYPERAKAQKAKEVEKKSAKGSKSAAKTNSRSKKSKSKQDYDSDSSSRNVRGEEEPEEAEEAEEEAAAEVEVGEEVDETEWLLEHPSIGTKIAKEFKVNRAKFIFKGTVAKYAPPTSEGADDQLYRVVFEDGDSEDFSESDLAKGMQLFAYTFPDDEEIVWLKDHKSVGTKVAGEFEVNGGKKKVFFGHVSKYAAPSAEGESDQLYHIKWEDGDSEDFSEDEFQKAIELYADQGL